MAKLRRLTECSLLEIRQRYWAGLKVHDIAKEYGISGTQVTEICQREKLWCQGGPLAPGEPATLPPRVPGRHRRMPRIRAIPNKTGILGAEQALEVRQLWWRGAAQQEELAQRFKISQPCIWLILHRRTYRSIPPFPADENGPGELELLAAWQGNNYRSIAAFLRDLAEPCHPELEAPVQTGTGRLVDPTGQVHGNIRRAEIATGVDRMEIAAALADGRWTYEPGEPPPESTAIYWDVPLWSELRHERER